MKIRLCTHGNIIVYECNIPPFNQPPTVINWGDRTFIFSKSKSLFKFDTYIYTECFAYTVF